MLTRPLLLSLVVLSQSIAACQTSSSEEIGQAEQAVIGGTVAPFDEAVVAVFVGGLCTGTLIAPRVVLTAAHCVGDAIVAGQTSTGSVRFGNGEGPWIDTIPVVDMTMHRLYDPPAFLRNDIAVLRLQRDAPSSIEPLPVSRKALTEEDVGLQLRVVGFGNSEIVTLPDGTTTERGAGTKRQATLPLLEVFSTHISYGDTQFNTCQGDSGGPTFAEIDGEEQVVGVTSFGASGCQGRSFMTRVDVNHEALLDETLAAWSGPCQHDGVCVEEGCGEFPDPDCDICGMNNQCGTDCPRVDRDCPLAGLPGDSCQSDTGCESRLCATAPEDERVKYCSMPCDPSKSANLSGCFAPLTICTDLGDGTGVCEFPGLTPGVQGTSCEKASDCRSGLCDSSAEICVEPCGDGLPECPEEFQCLQAGSQRVCSIPQEDGGCLSVAGSRGSRSNLALLFLAIAIGLGRRRRA